MTFSVTGRCERSGMFGVAITTSSICVGSRCAWARAGVGAVVTQNITDPGLGDKLLDLMAGGARAEQAMASVVADPTAKSSYRQLAAVDRHGGVASHSGEKTLGIYNVSAVRNCVSAGNILTSEQVPVAMTGAFEQHSDQHLAPRLLSALEAGLAAGGEAGPVKSAALLVVHEQPWPLVDLRIDWDDNDAIGCLRRLWSDYEPQMCDYVTRAIDPSSAPAYGVPGDS